MEFQSNKSVDDNSGYDDNSSIAATDNTDTANSSFHGSGTSTPLNSSTYKEFDINSMYVWDTVAALPQKYKDVIYLFYHEQYSTNEIADILDISTDNVKTRLKKSKGNIKKRGEGL